MLPPSLAAGNMQIFAHYACQNQVNRLNRFFLQLKLQFSTAPQQKERERKEKDTHAQKNGRFYKWKSDDAISSHSP